jgi:hypothetical protein
MLLIVQGRYGVSKVIQNHEPRPARVAQRYAAQTQCPMNSVVKQKQPMKNAETKQ